jgi:hypothetical protein
MGKNLAGKIQAGPKFKLDWNAVDWRGRFGTAYRDRRLPASSALPLLVAGIGANHEHDASTPDDLALLTHATNAGANFHSRVRGGDRPRLQRILGG